MSLTFISLLAKYVPAMLVPCSVHLLPYMPKVRLAEHGASGLWRPFCRSLLHGPVFDFASKPANLPVS